MKSHLFYLAHSLRKQGLSMAEALRKAWATLKLKAEMLIRPVTFQYVKETGEVREAVGHYASAPQVDDKKPTDLSALAIKYFDLTMNGWRSFRADRLIIA